MNKILSLYDYEESLRVYSLGIPFNALIAAAMRRASYVELTKLKMAFPYVYQGLVRRLQEIDGVVEEWDGIQP